MKALKLIFAIAVCSLFSCSENMPEIACLSCDNNTTIITPDAKRVIIEKYTGVKCTNCPQASDLVEDLIGIYGEQVIEISIHSGFFARPYPESKYDFRTPDGSDLEAFIGAPSGYPAGTVNRRLFDTENSLQIGEYNKWSGMVADELEQPTNVNINITNEYDAGSKRLDITVSLTPTEDIINDDLFITLFLTESEIIDYQLSASVKIPDYNHKHVLRDILTNFSGDPINEDLLTGQKVDLTYSVTLDDAWIPENMDVAASVHFNSGANKYVVQAGQASVAD